MWNQNTKPEKQWNGGSQGLGSGGHGKMLFKGPNLQLVD